MGKVLDMTDTIEFEYEGPAFEADARELRSYRNSKAIANSSNDPGGYFAALERIFAGRDEEYAERLGGGADTVANLYVAAAEAAGAKNS